MSNVLTRTDPVPTTPFVTDGVTISLAPPMARYSLRARSAQALETALGVKVPRKIGATEGGIACLGPDEWLLRTRAGILMPMTESVAVTDVSERALCLIIEGPHAAELLQSGCPQDLALFVVGRATRTIYETVEIILYRDAEQRFQVEVWRSFAPWLWTALIKTARHLERDDF